MRHRVQQGLTALVSGVAALFLGITPAVAQYNSSWARQQQMQQQMQRQQQMQQQMQRQQQMQQQMQQRQQQMQQAQQRQQQMQQQAQRASQAAGQSRRDTFNAQRGVTVPTRGAANPTGANAYRPPATSAGPARSAPTTAIRGSATRNVGANEGRGFVSSGGIAKLTRPLTPGEIKRGFTGKVTGDGRALVRFQNRVFAVPAAGVSNLMRTTSLGGQTRRWTPAQKEAVAGGIRRLALSTPRGGGQQGGPPAAGARAAKLPDAQARITYAKFFRGSGLPYKSYPDHQRGVDFSKEVKVTRLKAGTVVCQHQTSGSPLGSYFAPCGSSPTKLGISERGHDLNFEVEKKSEKRFVLAQDVDVLESTAAPIVDNWSVPGEGVQTEGGGQQYYVRASDKLHFGKAGQ